MTKIQNLKIKIFGTIAYLALIALLYFFDVLCIFTYFFDTPCPGCGITRAMIAAVQLDFKSAFSCHLMFWSVPILYLYFLFDGKLFKNKFLNTAIFTVIAFGFILNWLIKIFC